MIIDKLYHMQIPISCYGFFPAFPRLRNGSQQIPLEKSGHYLENANH